MRLSRSAWDIYVALTMAALAIGSCRIATADAGRPTASLAKGAAGPAAEAADYGLHFEAEPTAHGPAGSYRAENLVHRFRASFSESGLRLASLGEATPSWNLILRPSRCGRLPTDQPVGPAQITATGDRIDYFMRPVSLRYVNGPEGLRQTVTFGVPGRGSSENDRSPLHVDLAMDTDLLPELAPGGRRIDLVTREGDIALRIVASTEAGARDNPPRLEILRDGGGAPAGLRFIAEDVPAALPVRIEVLILSAKAHNLELEGRVRSVAVGGLPGKSANAPAIGAAPVNDTCLGAVVIPNGPYPILSALTTGCDQATAAGDPGASCAPYVQGVWYKWTPSAAGFYTIKACSGPTATTDGDGVLAVYTSSGACGGSFTETACNDDGCHSVGPSIVSLNAASGTTYYILAGTYNDPGSPGISQYQLHIAPVAPPPNDTCASPTPILLDSPITATNAAAIDDYRLSGSGCFSGIGQTTTTAAGRDTVFSFTAPAAGSYSFRAQNVASGGGNVVVYAASTCPAATPPTPVTVTSCLAAANRNAFSGIVATEAVWPLSMSSGQQIFLFVDETAPSTFGVGFTLEANRSSLEAEPNDTPASPNALACPIEGSIGSSGDVDFYSLASTTPPSAGSRVFALNEGIAANANGDTQLRITTTTDTLEADDDDGDPSFGGLSSIVAGTPLAGTGSWFVRTNAFASTAALEPYRLYAVVQGPLLAAAPEHEPNSTLATASSDVGSYFGGELAGPAPSSDMDVYRFCARQGDLIFLGLDGDPLRDNTPINPFLSLLDDVGSFLVAVNDSHATSSTVPGPGSLGSTTPFSPAEALVWRARYGGTYYAVVSIGTSSTGPTGAGDYLLAISSNCLAGFAHHADLSVSQVGSPDPVSAGQNITFSITVSNAGPQAAMNVKLTDGSSPESDVAFQSLASPPGWTCTTPGVGGAGVIQCTIGCLQPGAAAQFSLVMKVRQCAENGARIENRLVLSSDTPDPDLSNNER